jgi:hypothetical protein
LKKKQQNRLKKTEYPPLIGILGYRPPENAVSGNFEFTPQFLPLPLALPRLGALIAPGVKTICDGLRKSFFTKRKKVHGGRWLPRLVRKWETAALRLI